MARGRNLKPGFFKNEELVELPFEDRLLFAGLWTLADCRGVLEFRPKRIKMELFPADDVDVVASLDRLAERGLIRVYEAQGVRAILIPKFLTHQNPHHREKPSDVPMPEADPVPVEAETVEDSGEPEARPGPALGQPEASRALSPFPFPESSNPPSPPEGGTSRSRAPSVTPARIREDFPDVPVDLASEFLAYRKRKAPLTETAWVRMAGEIRKSGLDPPDALGECMARGWRGFKSSWVTGDDHDRRPDGGKQTPADRVRLAWERRLAQDG